MPYGLAVPPDQAINFGSIMTIEELTPTSPGGKPRKVILLGPSLPFQGAEWGSDSKVITTWYPGNGIEASQQNLGSTELPSSWQGEWNRTRMGRAPTVFYDETGTPSAIIDPSELWLLLDDIRASGARLRVTWAVRGKSVIGTSSAGKAKDESFEVVREGRMKSLRAQVIRHTDITWTAEFHWASRGGKQEKVANVRREDNLALATTAVDQSIAALLTAQNDKMVSVNQSIRKSANFLTLGQLEAFANGPQKMVDEALRKLQYNVNQFKRVSDIARKLTTTPFSIANSVLDFARNTVAICNQTVDSWSRTPAEQLTTKDKVADLVRATKYYGNVMSRMSKASRDAAALDQTLRSVLVSGANRGALTVRESSTTRAGDIIAIHVCKSGDTPQRVSAKYYQTADQADAILRANRLPLHTPTFRPGLPLVIPALVTSTRTTT